MVMSLPDVSCGDIVAVTFNSFIFRILGGGWRLNRLSLVAVTGKHIR
jgi:hypothetical protein